MATNHRICSIPNCGKAFYGRGFCQSHLRALRLYGDPLGNANARRGETWRFVDDVASKHTGDECLMWPFGGRRSLSYPRIMLNGVTFSVTRLLCERRNGPPAAGDVAAHSCGMGHAGCVNPKHLRWATAAENSRERRDHGTMPIGAKSGTAKLTEDQARYIKAMRGRISERKLAAQFGVSSTAVRFIHLGRNWGWLDQE